MRKETKRKERHLDPLRDAAGWGPAIDAPGEPPELLIESLLPGTELPTAFTAVYRDYLVSGWGPPPVVVFVRRRGVSWIPFGRRMFLPSHYLVRVDEQGNPPCTFAVSIPPGRDPEVEWLAVGRRRAGDRPLTAVSIRLPLGRYLSESRKRAAVRVTTVDGSVVIERAHYPEYGKREIPRELGKVLEARARARHKPGKTLPDELLERVAAIYRAHVEAGGRAPVKSVADALPCSPASASRYVEEARRRSFLGKAAPRKAGELPAGAGEDDQEQER